MLSTGFTLSPFYLQLIAEQLTRSGVDANAWLAHRQLSLAQLADSNFILPYPLFRQLIRDAIALTNEPALGVLVGERLLATTHGMLGFAAMNSGSIRQLLELLTRFMGTRIALFNVSTYVSKDCLTLQLDELLPLGDIQKPIVEAVTLAIKNMLDYLTLGKGEIRAMHFPFAQPDYVDMMRAAFKCQLVFEQATIRLILPLTLIDQSLLLADPQAFAQASHICQNELEKIASSETISDKVKRIILNRQHDFPSLQRVAALLNLTPRTLHRRLQQENTSFQQLVDQIRQTLAREYLQTSTMSVQQIAYALGYNDAANFRRAFKRWHGYPPRELQSS